ncbi:MAG: peptidylprolyl isomerase [Romboutsia sp.]
MKRKINIGIISLLILSIVGCNNTNIATVNGVDITKEEYEKTKAIIEKSNNYIQGSLYREIETFTENNNKEKIKDEIISFMVDNEVLYQTGKENAFTPTKEDINLRYEEIEDSFKFNENYQKLIEELQLDKDYLIEEIKKDMTINNYKLNFEKTIKITNQQIKDYYIKNKNKFNIEEINVSHILISTLNKDNKIVNKSEKDILRKKAEDIIIKITNGEKLEKLAQKYSDDKQSSKSGGELGYFSNDDKNKEFTNQVFKLNKGEIPKIIETSYGYHIIKVNDKIYKQKSLDESTDKIKEEILKNHYIKHIEKLSKESKIKIN